MRLRRPSRDQARSVEQRRTEREERRKRDAEVRTRAAIEAAAARRDLTRAALRVRLLWLKARYRWKVLDLVSPATSEEFEVYGEFSPGKTIGKGKLASRKALIAKVEKKLQAIADRARDQLVAEPERLLGLLSSAEREAEKKKPFLDRANFGKAVESWLELQVAFDPELRTLVEHRGGAGRIDFEGIGEIAGTGFEITTDVPSTIEKHRLRSWFDENRDRIISYRRLR